MSNIIKGIYIWFLVFYTSISWGQKIMDVNLNLNPGGEIYDIEYLEVIDCWVVVGDFSSIGGVTLNNVAFLTNSFTVISGTPGTDGPVYGVESYHYGSPFGTTNIYIAGEFTTFNGQPRVGAARFNWFDTFAFPDPSPLADTWDPEFDGYCFDVEEYPSNRVVFTGAFTDINQSTTNDVRFRIAGFWADSGNDYATLTNYDSFSPAFCWDIDVVGGWMYLAAEENQFIKMNPGFTSAIVAPPGSFKASQVVNLDDSLIIVGYDPNSGGLTGTGIVEVRRKSDLTEKNDHAYSVINGGIGSYHAVESYDEYLFLATGYNVHRFKLEDINLSTGIVPDLSLTMTTSDIFSLNIEENSSLGIGNYKNNLLVENNILTASWSNLGSASGQSRTALALYCLPPKDPDWFTAFDTIVCHNDIVDFAFPTSEFAEGYKWEFSNTTVDLDTSNAPVQTVFVTSSPTLALKIMEDFIPGTLTATPFTTCNGTVLASDSSFSKSISINLTLDDLPNAVAGPDTTLTCYFPSIDLIGNSDSSGVTYEWKMLGTPNFTPGQVYTASDSNEYVLRVENPLGCLRFDTLLVDIDTIKPTFDLVPGPFDLTCNDTVIPLLGNVNNTTDTLNFWITQSTGDTTWSNPIWVNTPGEYLFLSQNTYNGCIDSLDSTIVVQINESTPQMELLNKPWWNAASFADTVNCYTPVINLQGDSPTPNTELYWIADSLNITSLGAVATVTTDTTILLYAIDTSNGCSDLVPVMIHEMLQIPSDSIHPFNGVNCSYDSTLIYGTSTFPNTNSEWTGPGISPTLDSVWISQPGHYYLTTTWNENGCVATDSLELIPDTTIDLIVSNDTVVCDQTSANVNVTYIGDITGITYLWDNGATTSSANYIGGNQPYAFVEVSGNGGCYGSDTVWISIPPVPEVDFQGFAPCASGGGSITATPISGWAPFQYSIDNGQNYQSSTTFNNLNEGTYDILVQDSLGCNYPFMATIDQNSQSVQAEFLVQTYNQQSDTLMAIDVSLQSADSLVWVYPSNLIVIDETDQYIQFVLPDTGSFDITMEAYFGGCQSSMTKTIYVSEYDSSSANQYNQLGIKTVNIYPNPNNGQFTVEVELFGKQDVVLKLFDNLGNQYIDPIIPHQDVLNFTQAVDVTITAANAGTYYLVVIAEYDLLTYEIVIAP